jgi:hypothetical protein
MVVGLFYHGVEIDLSPLSWNNNNGWYRTMAVMWALFYSKDD